MDSQKIAFKIYGLVALTALLTACGGGQNSSVVDETYIHKYGVTVPSDYWRKAGEEGTVIRTMTDGVVVTSNYSAGKLDGETKYSYPHSSQIQKSEYYLQGTLARETEFFFDGTPKIDKKVNSPQEEITTITTWYLNGTPKSIEQLQQDKMVKGEYFTSLNQRDALVEQGLGTRIIRDDYGNLLSTDTMHDGSLTMRITYYPNGSPRETIPYKNGIVEGTKRTFNPAGDPATVEQWRDGGQNGLTICYQHGEKFSESNYVNGEKQGKELRYRDGSKVVQKSYWFAGKMNGPATSYIGDVVKTDWYFKGDPTTKADFEYMLGKAWDDKE